MTESSAPVSAPAPVSAFAPASAAPSSVPTPVPVPMPVKDQAALAQVGAAVRQRLAQDPGVYQVPTEMAEVFSVHHFLTPTECEHLITIIDAAARPSTTFDPENPLRYRTSWSGDVDRVDPFIRSIERRIDDLLGMEHEMGETVQGQRYHPGQEFQGHYDWFYTSAPYWPHEEQTGGQRSWTAMVYLNDVEAGGTTGFPWLNRDFVPTRGVLLTWNNARPDGLMNEATFHAARPVEKGVKYVITKWYRTRRWG